MSDFDTLIHSLYLVAAACFVAGLHLMNSPASARRGNFVSGAGMVLAFVTTIALLARDHVMTGVGARHADVRADRRLAGSEESPRGASR